MKTPFDPKFIIAYLDDKGAENPQIKTIQPFSNGTEAETWLCNNCYECTRAFIPPEGIVEDRFYQEKLFLHKECPIKYALEVGFISGKIREDVGCDIMGTDESTEEFNAYDYPRCAHWKPRQQDGEDGINTPPENPNQLKIEFSPSLVPDLIPQS